MDTNVFAKTALFYGGHREFCNLASWQGSEMKRMWSDAISVVLYVWPAFCKDLRFHWEESMLVCLWAL